ncbi:MAG: S-methyl-5-thioribose-1-phosphate isomerase [Gammaproteobacteria bacterium]|nr:S-methyl-5-thioribose-1-phosphate isomerase [Gammaproteobacteria bacterium]
MNASLNNTNVKNDVRAFVWRHDHLLLLDQRRLPQAEIWETLSDLPAVAAAIHDMRVRGAPAIGICAAYAVVLAAQQRYAQNPQTWTQLIQADLIQLVAARPTAVNLQWAVTRMQQCILENINAPDVLQLLENAARNIEAEDLAANYRMAEWGAAYLNDQCGVLTHCNTGSLATAGHGTALGVIRTAHRAGKIGALYADETRPWLQGSRLTAWELSRDNIPVTLICEGAAASLMQQKKVDWIIVGADRITANGDVANKIGTYSLAVLAKHHGVKVMVVAPSSTVDLSLTSGAQIHIEERSNTEILTLNGHLIDAENINAWNPVFDITPAELIDVLVTERGVIEKPALGKLAAILN